MTSRATIPETEAPAIQVRVEAPLRRGLSRDDAARYVGIGTTKFDEMVTDGRMPKPRRIDGRKVWDVRELDLSFDALPMENAQEPGNSWGDR